MQALFGHPEGEVPQQVLASDFVVAIPTHYTTEHRIAATRSSRLVFPAFAIVVHNRSPFLPFGAYNLRGRAEG